jgi:hypothetical protein
MGMEDLSYDTFKLAYDSDPVIQALTHGEPNTNGVELKTKAQGAAEKQAVDKEQGASVVSKMAKSATKRAMADS